MSFEAGHKLSHYEIVEPIGRGGMGEVYRAKDSKLGRDVAIKVLPDEFAQDEERLRRFQREAKVLASLNHPNIAAIYGLEQSDDAHYLVLELVPGETLAERIARGPIPVDEALEITASVAEALEEAHEQGIVHRDLKPANVKITPDGKVKVLDFGLAKAFAEETSDTDSSMSPTITRDATRVGVILGTAAYMSPEQAKGKRVDKRSDVFSFGALLFEMLAGRKAFPGDDVSEVLASVIKLEPDWRAMPGELDPRLADLIRRCLRKDSKKRLRDIGDARNAVDELLATPYTPSAQAPNAAPAPRRTRERFLWGLVALLTGLVAGVAVWSVTRPDPRSPTRFSISIPETDRLSQNGIALSPNGRELVYVASRDGVQRLFRRPMGELEAVPIRSTEGAAYPFFSPDGTWIGFFADDKLKKVPLAGGPAATLCDTGFRQGASWGEDDTIVFASFGSRPLMRVSSAGGAPEPVTTVDGENQSESHIWPNVLPGGKAVLFMVHPGNLDDAQIAVHSLETGETKRLVDGTHPHYVGTGHILFGRQSSQSLWAAPFDLGRLELTGEPAPVLEGVAVNPGGGLANFVTSAAGSLAYIPTGLFDSSVSQLVWVDREGKEELALEDARMYQHPRLAPDDQRIVVTILEPSLATNLWIASIPRGTLTRLTFESEYRYRWPIWAPDGERVIFGSSAEASDNRMLSKAANGSGTTEELIRGASRFPSSVSSDGKTIVFGQAGDGDTDIGFVQLDAEGEPVLLLHEPYEEHTGMLSPDDRWLAYVSDETGRQEVYVTGFSDVDGKWQVSTEGGTGPAWSRDGSELFFRNGDKMMAVTISTDPEPVLGSPTLLFEGSYVTDLTNQPGTWYDVAADGRFLMGRSVAAVDDSRVPIHVILDWLDELEHLVPTP